VGREGLWPELELWQWMDLPVAPQSAQEELQKFPLCLIMTRVIASLKVSTPG
jgi:hypothetical protein